MNITIPSVTPCITVTGNTGIFILGIVVGFILAIAVVWGLYRQR